MNWHWRGRELWLGRLFVGEVVRFSHDGRRPTTPWRGWLMLSAEGDEIGWYASEDEARAAIEAKAREFASSNREQSHD